jgi:hypothetical protein
MENKTKSIRITTGSMLALEELRLHLLKRRKGSTITKTELLGTLINMYSEKLKKLNEENDHAI